MRTRGMMLVIVGLMILIAVAFGTRAPQVAAPTLLKTVSYVCKGDKTIEASYYQGESKPASVPGMPPVPGGSVGLSLSDGRTMSLTQTISADGIRYANADESFVFWSKGEGALVLEDNEEKSYIGCIAVAPATAALPQVYANSEQGFTIRLPEGYATGTPYTYTELGPKKGITGVKFSIPAAVAAGTNLSADSYISVEEVPQVQDCSAALFLDRATVRAVTDGDTTYSVASSTGAAAGNRYNETIYALPGTNPCVAVRYFIHYGVIENYPPGAVRAFDERALLAQFDSIRRTLMYVQ